jgi:hypothetical protein
MMHSMTLYDRLGSDSLSSKIAFAHLTGLPATAAAAS